MNLTPRKYPGVMVSSTFSDLEEHRAAMIETINAYGLKAVAMEYDAAKPDDDVIESSFKMVGDSAAYVAIISHRYGQIPDCPNRNPDKLSLTELEFNRAFELDRPIILFIMGDGHKVKPSDIEINRETREKLIGFRERAKRLRATSAVHRVYKVFDSFEEFQHSGGHSIADLRSFLQERGIWSESLISPPASTDYSDLDFDQRPKPRCTISELDLTLIRKFINMPLCGQHLERLGLNANHPGTSLEDILRALDCLCDGYPTNGLFLCFAAGQSGPNKPGACNVDLVRYDGTVKGISNPSNERVSGNLIKLYVEGMDWLKHRAGLRAREVGRVDRDELEVPEAALREAFANALVHREYDSTDVRQPTRVEVYSDRIEIISFGNLLPKVSIDSLNSPTGPIAPWRRNGVIVDIFKRMTFVESNADGVLKMRASMERASLAFPRFIDDTKSGVVRVILIRPPQSEDYVDNELEKISPNPGQYRAFVTSMVNTLPDHRKVVFDTCRRMGLFPYTAERVADESKLLAQTLRKLTIADIFIGIYGWNYGQILESEIVSVQEAEFDRAVELGLPMLVFLMHDDHPVTRAMVETDESSQMKLEQFRSRARSNHFSGEFKSPDDLRRQLWQNLAEVLPQIQAYRTKLSRTESDESSDKGLLGKILQTEPIPVPPEFYTEPPYIGSHIFVGRKAQLDTLSDWASASDPHPILLFEAIGGTGKSMLTWEWIINYSTDVRTDWAGRFWYSFYERGAIMADFCARALAYITGGPLDDFRKQKTPVLAEKLLRHLREKPYLFVLDGLERVLVSYHRIDAAELADEDAGTSGEIPHRDPCAAIRPEDDDLLRVLTGASPSKILITSRLIPRVLLNASSQPIPGVLRERLPGLRPVDAEALLRSCGVRGESRTMQNYLQTHCDCHPLITGVIAALITNYFPDRGNFDAWVADREAGGALNLAELDLVQKRNHILRAALAAVPPKSRQLLSLFALLSQAVDAATLGALNPFLPPEPEELERPERPEDNLRWNFMPGEEKAQALRDYRKALEGFEAALAPWRRSPEYRAAERDLAEAARDLEHRGMLQYDPQTRRYDLHPIVRGVAASGLQADDTERYGQRVLDYFSRQAHNPYDQVETIEDLRVGLQLVRLLQRMGHVQAAVKAYRGELANALLFNLEAHAEVLALIRPFFPGGWGIRRLDLDESDTSYLLAHAGIALDELGEAGEALVVFGLALESDLRREDWRELRVRLSNLAWMQASQGKLAQPEKFSSWTLHLATLVENPESLFRARLNLFWQYAVRGAWNDAGHLWQALDPMGRAWNRATYRPGEAERLFAQFRLWRGDLHEADLNRAEGLARAGRNRPTLRMLHSLRGEWMLEQRQWSKATENLNTAVALAHEVGARDIKAETMLTIARFHLGQLPDPRQTAEQFAHVKQPFHRGLADLWLLAGDEDKAKHHALAAYKDAWADGEPYVFRYELDKSRELLERLGAEVPDLPPYDPARDKPFPWEADVVAAIEKLRAETEANAKKEADGKAKKNAVTRSKRTKSPTKPRTKE